MLCKISLNQFLLQSLKDQKSVLGQTQSEKSSIGFLSTKWGFDVLLDISFHWMFSAKTWKLFATIVEATNSSDPDCLFRSKQCSIQAAFTNTFNLISTFIDRLVDIIIWTASHRWCCSVVSVLSKESSSDNWQRTIYQVCYSQYMSNAQQ